MPAEGDDPEQQPLNPDPENNKPADPPKNDDVSDGKPKPGEYIEMRKRCYCFSLKCDIIFGACLLIALIVLANGMEIA